MKIAICLKGQLRTAIPASASILNYLRECIDDCDFFFHTWNITARKRGDNRYILNPDLKKTDTEYIEAYQNSLVTDTEWKQLLNTYHPKKYEIEDYINYVDTKDPNGGQTDALYSCWRSLQIKDEYEREMGVTYDYVLSIRFDMAIYCEHSIKETIKNLQFVDRIDTNVKRLICNVGSQDIIVFDNKLFSKIEEYISPYSVLEKMISKEDDRIWDYSLDFLQFCRSNFTSVRLESDNGIGSSILGGGIPCDPAVIWRPEVGHLNYIDDYQLLLDEFEKDKHRDIIFNNLDYR